MCYTNGCLIIMGLWLRGRVSVLFRDAVVTGVMVNHGKIPDVKF